MKKKKYKGIIFIIEPDALVDVFMSSPAEDPVIPDRDWQDLWPDNG